jgi:hypothetical protein
MWAALTSVVPVLSGSSVKGAAAAVDALASPENPDSPAALLARIR